MKFFQSHQKNGFTMVETLVAIAVLGIFFIAVANLLHLILQNVGESRVRSVALSLAQSKMETIRNLSYNNIGTIGGIPDGPTSPSETVTINTMPFTVTTSIIYIDDPFDNLAPQDLINTDYKRVRIEVTWGGVYPSRIPISLVSNFSPKGIETTSGGGTLFLSIFDSQGIPVTNATVIIDNTTVNPAIHMQTLSDNQGLVIIPGSPTCLNCYEITVTKTNFSTDKTYSTSLVANPVHPFLSVFEGQITNDSYAIDKVSSVAIRSLGNRESGYPLTTNVMFALRGSKIIGYDTNDEPVYKYAFSTNTGGGYVQIPSLEWDTYTLDFSNSFHDLAGSNPLSPFALLPDMNLSIDLVTVPKTNTSILIAVKNVAGELQSSASANLISTPSANLTKYTAATGSADFGQAFFGGLTPGAYDLKINLSGYQEATATLNIVGSKQESFFLKSDAVINMNLKKNHLLKKQGFTLVEIILASFIFVLIAAGTAGFSIYYLKNYSFSFEENQVVGQAQTTLTTMVREIREARFAEDGAWAIAQADDNIFIFYSDTTNDGKSDRVRYFLDGTQLKKGVIEPTAVPVTYPLSSEKIYIIASNIENNSTPLFRYYNGNWPSDITNNPLITSQRILNTGLVKLFIRLNINTNTGALAYELTQDVQIRSLKDNL